ncbi:hypothetical protein AST00_01265 [Staphylococcus equorum]|uniref:hypothetical protein n=1 Tax=Staphylococcus TaxID=1279 RepID=UPI000852BBD2|nr:hypothetical protein [Staphylococcus equorum]MDG0837189.1 hypothetical protein [Staphylococcus equorum]MDK9872610.1 hypothetical protein [Staphylococcus equorum]MDK9877368.1 hypothetical protein [Staphylococcus equorum]MDN5829527.1 hypothetical protein [Staphylococcus equorum]MDN6849593.1 hypothetical protein [Staphylococcus equorum]
MTEEKAKMEKIKKLAMVGNILGCLTIVLFILRFVLDSNNGDSILKNAAFVTALLTFTSYLIGNLISKTIIGSIASLMLVIFIIITLLT